MNRVAIITDSIASIPETLMRSLPILHVPYYIHHGGKVLRDLVTVQREEFYRWLPTLRELPQTAAPGLGDYYEAYASAIREGVREIVSIHMSSRTSGAYAAAVGAREMILEKFPETGIDVIDTLNVAMCQGWMVIEAARLALGGSGREEIVRCVQRMIPVTHMIQTADTLRYLYMGGRIGRARHLLGSLLDIKPLIGMLDGQIVALGSARTRNKAYQAMLAMIEAAVGRMGRIKIAFVHAAAPDEAQKLKKAAEERLNCVECLVSELSPALGVHSGPGTVGVAYFPLDPLGIT